MSHPNPRWQASVEPSLLTRLDELVISLTIRCRIAEEDGKDLPLAADLARIGAFARRCLTALRRRGGGAEERLAAETGGRVVAAVRDRTGAPDALEQAWLLSLLLPDLGSVRWIGDLPVARKEQAGGAHVAIVGARPEGRISGEGVVVGLARGFSVGLGFLVPHGDDRVLALGVLSR